MDVDHQTESTGESQPPPQPAETLSCGSTTGSKSNSDGSAEKLTALEQKYQETVKALEREERRLNERRKHSSGSTTKLKKLVQDAIELNALKQFNDLQIEHHRRKAKNPHLKLCPSLDASMTIARRLGRTNYYARRLREKLAHLYRVGELQVSKQGKGAVHQSLLSEPRVAAAIQNWVKGAVPVEKGGYIGRV